MRTSNTLKNSLFSIIESMSNIFINFFSRAIFIYILGKEYLGLNSLFSSILTTLNLFELGVGSAIIYYLYEPLAKNNVEKIKSLIAFYKHAFNVISLVILSVGILLIPILPIIIGKVTVDINITIIYLLFLISTVSSYILTYKRGLIYADQKNYIINIVHSIYLILLNILQLFFLYFTKNYYVYLIIKIVCQFMENIVLYCIADKLYPFIKEQDVKKLSKEDTKLIYNKIKALFFHKTSATLINGADNILISYFYGVIMVGLYSNYSLIISAVLTLLSQIVASSIPSIGNLLVTESDEKVFSTFRHIRFINFYLSAFFGICILFLTQPFIQIWVGNEYLMSFGVLIVLVINFYQKGMRQSYIVFKDAAGVWEEDKIIPVLEAILNVSFSIIFAKFIGVIGIFLGTIVSGLLLWLYSYPKFVYKKILKRSYFNYFKETIGYILLFLVVATISGLLIGFVQISNVYLNLIINFIICFCVFNLLIYIIFRETDNFKYIIGVISNLFHKFLK